MMLRCDNFIIVLFFVNLFNLFGYCGIIIQLKRLSNQKLKTKKQISQDFINSIEKIKPQEFFDFEDLFKVKEVY